MSYNALGGWSGITENLPGEFLKLNNVRWQDIVNWAHNHHSDLVCRDDFCIKRIYATRSVNKRQKAWFIAVYLSGR